MTDKNNKREHIKDQGGIVDEKSENVSRPVLKELFECEELYKILIETLNDGLGIQDEKGDFIYINSKLSEMFKYSREEMIGRPVTDFLDEDNRKIFETQMVKRRKGESSHYEIVWRGKHGRRIPAIMSPRPIFDDDGVFKGSFAIFTDITEHKKMEEELRRLSITDDLTGLYNYRCFYMKIAEEVNRARRMSYPLHLLIFDIDNFKSFNDTYGHIMGDEILRGVGSITKKFIRKDVDSAFRYGGDEFAIILPYTKRESAIELSKRIGSNIEKDVSGTRISIGIASSVDHESFEEVIKAADRAMYVDKGRNKSKVQGKRNRKATNKKTA